MRGSIQIRSLQTIGDPEIQGLSDVLIDCVEGGSSIGFMLPMSRAKAEAFWHIISASVAHGERVVCSARLAALRSNSELRAMAQWDALCDHDFFQVLAQLSTIR